jgi:hypothetical protein
MCTFQETFLFQRFQVSPDRGLGGFQQFTQVRRPGDLVLRQKVLDAISSLSWDQRFAHQSRSIISQMKEYDCLVDPLYKNLKEFTRFYFLAIMAALCS